MAVEDPLYEAWRLEEERRLLDPTFQEERRNNRIKVVREISDLEKDRDLTVNRLRELINQSVSQYNFSVVEEVFIALFDLNSALNCRILDWEDLLDLDQSGNPVYPNRDQPEFHYSPEAEDFPNKTKIMEEVLAKALEVLKAFFTSLPAADQAIVSQEAKTGLLKNPVLWLTGFSKSYSSKKFSASSSSSLASSSSISLSRRKCQKKTPSANFKLSQEETSTLESHPTGSSNSFSRSLNESSSQRSSSGGLKSSSTSLLEESSLLSSSSASLSQGGTSIKSVSEVSTSSLESPCFGSSNSSAGSLTMASTNL